MQRLFAVLLLLNIGISHSDTSTQETHRGEKRSSAGCPMLIQSSISATSTASDEELAFTVTM